MKYQFGRGARSDSSENMLQSNSENIKMSTSLQSSFWNAREDIVVQLNSPIVMLFPFPPSRSPLIVVCIILLNLHHRVKRSYSIIHSAGLFGCGIDSSPAAGTWGCLGLYPLYGIHTSALSNTCCRKGSSLSENIFRVMKDTCWKTLVSSIFRPLNTQLPGSNATIPCWAL